MPPLGVLRRLSSAKIYGLCPLQLCSTPGLVPGAIIRESGLNPRRDMLAVVRYESRAMYTWKDGRRERRSIACGHAFRKKRLDAGWEQRGDRNNSTLENTADC